MKKKCTIPAELNSQLIRLRNRDLYAHFNRLSQIKARKNIYKFKKEDIFRPRNPNSFSNECQQKIRRDNSIMAIRLDGIDRRKNKILEDDLSVRFYIDLFNKNSICAKKRIANKLTEENNIFKQRLKNQRPVIDDKKLKEEFDNNRLHFNIMRKIKPSSSCGNIYITPAESAKIREYQKLTLSIKGNCSNNNSKNLNNRYNIYDLSNMGNERTNEQYNKNFGTLSLVKPKKLPKIKKFWYLINGISNS